MACALGFSPGRIRLPAVYRAPCDTMEVPYRGVNVLLLWAQATDQGIYLALLAHLSPGLGIEGARAQRRDRIGGRVFEAAHQDRCRTRQARKSRRPDRSSEAISCSTWTRSTAYRRSPIPTRWSASRPSSELRQPMIFFTNTGALIVPGGNTACYIPLARPHSHSAH